MIHILGAGSMGCLWAAHLSHSNTVCFVSRKPATNSSKQFILHKPYKRDASCYQIPSLTIKEIIQETIHPTTDQDSLSSIDTLLVCTKSYDTLSALTELKPKLTVHTNIILFQNGLGSQYDIINAFPDNPIFAAVSTEGANRKSETEIIHAGVGETKLGLLTTSKPNLLDACFQTLATSGLIVHKHPDIWQALWSKLIINCAINPFTALLDLPNGQIQHHDYFKKHWPTLKKELSQLLSIANYPMKEADIEQLVFDVMDKTQDNISSMLQDIRNQKPTEIDHINGFAYRYLKQHLQAHQINKLLWESVNAFRN
ncbi:MAG: 2-dehydropantoate 2-reductase [Oleiphilaceae bacterium]|jgi:2-dehydropantoate 2-reductase